MAGCTPRRLRLEVPTLRKTLRQARPAAQGITPKTWANSLSRFGLPCALPTSSIPNGRALPCTTRPGAADPSHHRGQAVVERTGTLSELVRSSGLTPDEVDDAVVRRFHVG